MRPLVLALLLTVGCGARPANDAHDTHDAVGMSFKATLSSTVSSKDLKQTACALAPIVPVAGERHAVTVWIDARRCDAAIPDSTLRLDISHDNTGRIVLEMPVPPGSSAEEMADIERGLDEIRAELERRIRESPVRSSSRTSQKLLGATIVLGSIAFLTGTAGAIIVGVGLQARRGGDDGIIAAGGGLIGFGAGAPLLAGVIALIFATRSAENGD
jgi:hypothetical protein